MAVADDVVEPAKALEVLRQFEAQRKRIPATLAKARRIIRAAPTSDGARVMREMIEMGEMDTATKTGFARVVRGAMAALKRRIAKIG
jgi:hypothetical protein